MIETYSDGFGPEYYAVFLAEEFVGFTKEPAEKTSDGFPDRVEVPPSLVRSTPERRINGGGCID